MTRLAAPLLAFALLAASCNDDTATTDAGGGNVVDMTMKKVDAGPVDSAMGMTATTLNSMLTTAQESPVCAMAKAGAMGSATVTVDATNTMITVTNFTWTGLSGPAMAAHVHAGATGVSGGVIFDLGKNPTSPIASKTFTAADYPANPPAGAPANFAAFVTSLKAGSAYINVHTAACGNGEIRGQIM